MAHRLNHINPVVGPYMSHIIWFCKGNATKLVLWEDAIEKIHIGKCYHIENCKVRVFEDCKFLNTNAFTKITEIDQIPNINLTTPHLQDNNVTGQCLGVNIKCTISCICCNKTIEDSQIVEDTVQSSKMFFKPKLLLNYL